MGVGRGSCHAHASPALRFRVSKRKGSIVSTSVVPPAATVGMPGRGCPLLPKYAWRVVGKAVSMSFVQATKGRT